MLEGAAPILPSSVHLDAEYFALLKV